MVAGRKVSFKAELNRAVYVYYLRIKYAIDLVWLFQMKVPKKSKMQFKCRHLGLWICLSAEGEGKSDVILISSIEAHRHAQAMLMLLRWPGHTQNVGAMALKSLTFGCEEE